MSVIAEWEQYRTLAEQEEIAQIYFRKMQDAHDDDLARAEATRRFHAMTETEK